MRLGVTGDGAEIEALQEGDHGETMVLVTL
jgi:hypothetical protein